MLPKKIKIILNALILTSCATVTSCSSNNNKDLAPVVYISPPASSYGIDNSLKPFLNKTSNLYGYKNLKNSVVIKAQFSTALSFNQYGIADVTIGKERKDWFKINKSGNTLSQSYFYDNGPDYYINGLSRFIENNKIGYVNNRGDKVIPAQFDWASSFAFNVPIAVVCNGCKEVWNDHSLPSEIKGGLWGIIDIKGNIITPIKYDNILYNDNSLILVKGKNKYQFMHNNKSKYYLLKPRD